MFLLLFYFLLFSCQNEPTYNVFSTTPGKISFHFKQNGQRIGTLKKLSELDTTITFAMNGCMYTAEDYMPPGLYIEKGKQVKKLVLVNNPSVNFGLSQGVFFIDKKGKAGIVEASKAQVSDYHYAVELAPLLVMNRAVNPRVKGMKKSYTRNGIGINKEGNVIFLESIQAVSMEAFADKFKSLGCTWAVYIDGAVSESWKKGSHNPEHGGQFGIMVAAHK